MHRYAGVGITRVAALQTWQEMSIFQKRISRPNQLATLRELESKVNVGKVIGGKGRWCRSKGR